MLVNIEDDPCRDKLGNKHNNKDDGDDCANDLANDDDRRFSFGGRIINSWPVYVTATL